MHSLNSPVRRIVRRGHSSHVGYFQSDKMRLSIAYESTLEREFLIRSEADSEVTAMFGQPETILWRDGNVLRKHIPDFRIVRAGCEELIEVKWIVDVPAIEVRTAIIKADQERLRRIYRIVSEDWIRAEPFFTNAKTLLRGRRQLPLPSVQHRVFSLLDRGDGALALADFRRPEEQQVISTNALYAMVLAGKLELVDPHQAITSTSLFRRRPC